MKNKVILKARNFQATFKNIDEKKFVKIHRFLTRLEDVESVKKVLSKKEKLIAMKKKLEEKEASEEEYGEQGSPEEYYSDVTTRE